MTSDVNTRSCALDFLRANAVLMVLLRHLPELQDSGSVSVIFYAMTQGGWVGVDLFFVLSGYLVSGLIFKEWQQSGRFDAWRFLIRRGLKIYPAFYCMILASAVMFLIKPGYVHWQALVAELLFVQNYFGGIWNHTWSLAVEEHFYLLLVGAMLLSAHAKIQPMKVLCVGSFGLIIGCLWLRLSIESVPYQHETHLFPTHLRMDSLAFGVLLRVLTIAKPNLAPNVSVRLLLILLASGLSGWAFFMPLGSADWITGFGFSLLSIASVVFIIALSNWPSFESNSVIKYIANIGSYSYSIYLWHMLLMFVFSSAAKRMWPYLWQELNTLLCLAWMFGGGIILAKLIEIPALSFRDRIFPSLSVPKLASHSQPSILSK